MVANPLQKTPKIARIGADGEAVLNVGSRDGLVPCWMVLYKPNSGMVIDPETGEELGDYHPGPPIYLQVNDIREKFSVARAWTVPDICSAHAIPLPFNPNGIDGSEVISTAMPFGVKAGCL